MPVAPGADGSPPSVRQSVIGRRFRCCGVPPHAPVLAARQILTYSAARHAGCSGSAGPDSPDPDGACGPGLGVSGWAIAPGDPGRVNENLGPLDRMQNLP